MPVLFLWAATGTQTWLRTTNGVLTFLVRSPGTYSAFGIDTLGSTTFGGRPTLLIILISAQLRNIS